MRITNFAFAIYIPLLIYCGAFSAECAAKSDFNLPIGIALNLGPASMSVTDTYDEENYVGAFGSGFGVGGQAFVLFPLDLGFQIGGNFDWMYSSHSSKIYEIDVFQPSFGPIARWLWEDKLDLLFYVNFSIGWVGGDALASCSKIVCHGGDFTSNMNGVILGARGLYPINKSFSVGVFLASSFQTLSSVPYKFLESGKYRDLEADIGVNYTNLGLSVIWYVL